MVAAKGKTFSFNIPGAASKTAGVKDYAGPPPPSAAYRVRLRRLTMDENTAGPCFLLLMEINEPKGSPRAKYNGFGIWANQNINDKGAGYINAMLEAIADGSPEAKDGFWESGAKAKQDEKGAWQVKKLGDFVVNSPDCDFEFVVTTKAGKHKGKHKLDIRSYIPLSESNLDADDGADDDDDYDDPVTSDDDDDDDSTGSDEGADDGDDGDDDDYDSDDDQGDIFDDDDDND